MHTVDNTHNSDFNIIRLWLAHITARLQTNNTCMDIFGRVVHCKNIELCQFVT